MVALENNKIFLECIKDIPEYGIFKGSLWSVVHTVPKIYYIEIENYEGEHFLINEKWSSHFKFLA